MPIEPRTTADFKTLFNRLQDEGVLSLDRPLRDSIPAIAARIEAERLSAADAGEADQFSWWILVGGDPPHLFGGVEWDW